jgi:hypothetical protein
LFFCAGVRQKENNNDANGSARDCLAESETPSTSATLGAGHDGFSNGPLLASGIDFHLTGIVLGHDIQLGNSFRWSSRLVRVGGAQKTRAQRHRTSNFWVTTGSEAEDREMRRIVSLEIDEDSSLLPVAIRCPWHESFAFASV